MTRKITKSNQSEQRSDRGAKRSDHGGAYSGAPALHPYARLSPFLLYVRCKSGVTFVRRCFRDEVAQANTCTQPLFYFQSKSMKNYIMHARVDPGFTIWCIRVGFERF